MIDEVDAGGVRQASQHCGPQSAKPKGKAEEEALSFNFLYFIIQKFKVSDLIEN